MAEPILCIAGKSQAAVDVLRASASLGVRRVCLPNSDDRGVSDWQPSLLQCARQDGIEIIGLEWAMEQPDLLFLSIEYDKILKPALFASCRLFNMHLSLLPRGRGCFTSIWPLLNGDLEHGVTLHQMDAGIDTGPIIAQRRFAIRDWMTSRDLYLRSLELGTQLVTDWLPRLLRGEYPLSAQSEEGATYYSRRAIDFSRAAEIEFNAPTQKVLRQIRAFTFPEYQLPTINGEAIVAAGPLDTPPLRSNVIIVATADGAVWLRLENPQRIARSATS